MARTSDWTLGFNALIVLFRYDDYTNLRTETTIIAFIFGKSGAWPPTLAYRYIYICVYILDAQWGAEVPHFTRFSDLRTEISDLQSEISDFRHPISDLGSLFSDLQTPMFEPQTLQYSADAGFARGTAYFRGPRTPPHAKRAKAHG